jgi:hypothetical protein
MKTVKGFFTVTAGVILGKPDPQYDRRYVYTSEDYAFDQNNGKPERFNEIKYEASDYALDITNPGIVNWVKTEFIWL